MKKTNLMKVSDDDLVAEVLSRAFCNHNVEQKLKHGLYFIQVCLEGEREMKQAAQRVSELRADFYNYVTKLRNGEQQ